MELLWEDDERDPMAPTLEERLEHLCWFVDKMREKYGMSIGYEDYDYGVYETDSEREARVQRERAEEARLLAAKFARMRRVSPKGTYVPAALAKAKRRVVPELG